MEEQWLRQTLASSNDYSRTASHSLLATPETRPDRRTHVLLDVYRPSVPLDRRLDGYNIPIPMDNRELTVHFEEYLADVVSTRAGQARKSISNTDHSNIQTH